MLGFFSLTNDVKSFVKKDDLYFVSIPDGLQSEEIKVRFAQLAQTFANHMDSNKVYLNFGKDEFIEYEYSMEL